MLSTQPNPTVIEFNSSRPGILNHSVSQGSNRVHVTRNADTSMLRRSVPPHGPNVADPFYSQVLIDSYRDTQRSPRYTPMSINSPTEYASRFKSRPATTTKLVEFDCTSIQMPKDISKSRGISGFFPPVKLRMVPGNGTFKSDGYLTGKKSVIKLQSKHVSSRTRSKSVKNKNSTKDSLDNPGTERFSSNVSPVFQADTLRSSTEFDDLTYLPPPRKVLKKHESPWAFRCRVKSNMNSLSKIIASKPANLPNHIW